MTKPKPNALILTLTTALIAASFACSADPEKTNAEATVKAPATNQLQSAKTIPPVPAPKPVKPIAIVLYNIHAVQVGGQVILVVPEHYLSDLTNIYPSQALGKLRLEEP